MTDEEVLDALCALAAEAGLRVRRIRGSPVSDGEPPAGSGVVRVRGEPWVVLSGADSVPERSAVLAAALREHAAAWLEDRYLPPRLRRALSQPGDDPARSGRTGGSG